MLSLFSIVAAFLIASERPVEVPANEDGSLRDTLQTVTVVADKGIVVSRKDIVNIQNGEEISGIINSIPALTLSDYGSATGFKTVSLRGLGAANTSIFIDGVSVGNIQNGQADLGFIDLANFSFMTLDYAQNSISFNSARPSFEAGERFNARARFYGGSFGTYNPSVRAEYLISDNLSAVANLSYFGTDGDFPYQDALGNTVRRVNNDLKQYRAGLDLFGRLSGGDWHAKAYFNNAERGTPGSTTYIENESRQDDRNGFLQFRMNNSFSPLYKLNLTAKIAHDNLDCYSFGRYIYNHSEFQLNSSHIFHINEWWMLSAAACLHLDGLDSEYDGSEYYSATRSSLQGALSSSFNFKRLTVNAALLYNGWFDKGNAEKVKRNCFSPSMDFRLKIFDGLDLTGFANRKYRVPTFNDLYYPGIGSSKLKAEDSWLSDIGVEYKRQLSASYGLTIIIDGFHYSLSNKITSMPDPEDPTGWTWLMYNIGKVSDNGFDASLAFNKKQGDFKFNLTARYSCQNAIDKTADSANYGKQIPYVAKHTVAAIANLDYKGWKANLYYNLRSGRSDTSGQLPRWNTLDISFSKAFDLRIAGLTVFLKGSNIFNERYEIVRYYPIPGISFTGGIELCI